MNSSVKTKHRAIADGHQDSSNGQFNDVVDFILGITFEIWEQRQVEQINHYYGKQVEVFSLDGITRGSENMVNQTHAMLEAFPDRLLLGDDVIWSGDMENGFSSHRISSPMTNLGASSFGPPTGKRVEVMNIADCKITNGQITREWLVRDNLALVGQLGLDPTAAAQSIASNLNGSMTDWLNQEYQRTISGQKAAIVGSCGNGNFAREVLEACWLSGDESILQSHYAPYCVLQRAPVRISSGRQQVLEHFSHWREALPHAHLSVDHICSQPFDHSSQHIAVRWSVAGLHEGGSVLGPATGRPVYIMGVTHWRVIGGRITSEWTVFDELAVRAQTLAMSS